MGHQDVIAFPRKAPIPELEDEAALESVFQRQAEVSLLACQIAPLLYAARVIWINGACLHWNELTMGQRAKYRNEAENLIKDGTVV